MNELPVIGSSCLRRDFWVPHWKHITARWKEMYGERLFRRPKKTILQREYHFFAAVLSEMDLGNVDTREA